MVKGIDNERVKNLFLIGKSEQNEGENFDGENTLVLAQRIDEDTEIMWIETPFCLSFVQGKLDVLEILRNVEKTYGMSNAEFTALAIVTMCQLIGVKCESGTVPEVSGDDWTKIGAEVRKRFGK